MPLVESEDIARAVCSDKWDGERLSSSLFKGSNTSVSRLKIVALEDSWDLFRRKVEKPPERTLKLIGTINVGKLKQTGESYEPAPKGLSVEPDPLEDYPSHAIIPEKISRGLANRILETLDIHQPPSAKRGVR